MSIYNIENELFSHIDEGYRDFSAALIPDVDNILGVRAPILHSLAKKYAREADGKEFLSLLPHRYHEENMLHGLMVGRLKEDECIIEKRIKDFLPYVSNWAVCDSFVSALSGFFKNKEKGFLFVLKMLSDGRTYHTRFALVAMLTYYIDEEYIERVLDITANIHADDYYVRMAQAWLVSVALAKQYETSLWIISEKRLDPWVHNKSIQKAKESLRVSEERKEYLDSLRIKGV